jgi:hypothetical protein
MGRFFVEFFTGIGVKLSKTVLLLTEKNGTSIFHDNCFSFRHNKFINF